TACLGNAANEFAVVSSRSFNVSETGRYGGSRQDPARMTHNFAGVQSSDDSRNDIVVRGNAPSSVLWRIEGVDVPNPNHFNIPGTSGGSVNIINFKTLANSDFYTGAFPAEVGNATGAAFDVRLRNGNRYRREYDFQFGFMGTELFTEGPINRESGSSYLVNYRYSTTGLFGLFGINIGTDDKVNYQDASFKLNFPLKSGGSISLFGLGGSSSIDIIVSDDTEPAEQLYGDEDRDQFFQSYMGVTGLSYKQPVGKKGFLESVLAVSKLLTLPDHDRVYRDSARLAIYNLETLEKRKEENRSVKYEDTYLGQSKILHYDFDETRISLNNYFSYRVSSKNIVKLGLLLSQYNYNYLDSGYVDRDSLWLRRWDAQGSAWLLQPFVQWKHKFNDRLDASIGVHFQHFTLNKASSSLEPRLALSYDLGQQQTVSLGAGLHSQTQPLYTYFYVAQANTPKAYMPGRELGFTKSLHLVAAYDKVIGNNTKVKSEMYYQHLYDVPVGVGQSSYSLINAGAGFSRVFPDTLMVNTGLGRNYGVELGVERFFSNQFYYLINASIYQSEYQGNDKVWRNTEYNGNYIFNASGGKEFDLSESVVLGSGLNLRWAGGKRYSPADTAASRAINEYVHDDRQRNILQYRDYFRLDVKVYCQINSARGSRMSWPWT
ncbi:MAG: TonB-dependent receptor, partial [Cytophagales bacterium]|nr:TonB-dependent receptor [Cytophagales bacterium]